MHVTYNHDFFVTQFMATIFNLVPFAVKQTMIIYGTLTYGWRNQFLLDHCMFNNVYVLNSYGN